MNILLVDPFSSGNQLAPLLLSKGHNVYAVISSSGLASFYFRSLRAQDFEELFTLPEDQTVFNTFLASTKIDQVLAASEPGVDLANDLAIRMELPCHDPASKNARRDKFEMQNCLKQAGIRSIKQGLVKTYSDLQAWMQLVDQKFPIILKPLRSAGTDGVSLISNPFEAQKYFEDSKNSVNVMGESNSEFLAQELINGTEYVVDTISQSGNHQVVALWRYNKIEVDGNILYNTMELLTAERAPKNLIEYTFSVLSTLGIAHGPAHSEVFIDRDGPVLCETGARIHGGQGPSLAKRALGFNQVDLTADLLTGELQNKDLWVGSKPAFALEVFGRNQRLGLLKNSYSPKYSSISEFKLVETLGGQIDITRDLISSPSRLLIATDESDLLKNEYENFRNWETVVGYV